MYTICQVVIVTKIKQDKNLRGKIFLQQKFSDLLHCIFLPTCMCSSKACTLGHCTVFYIEDGSSVAMKSGRFLRKTCECTCVRVCVCVCVCAFETMKSDTSLKLLTLC